MRHVAKKWPEFHRNRNSHRSFHRTNDIHVSLFNFESRDIHIGRNRIDVALDGVCASILHRSGILGPAAQGRSIQACNDGNSNRALNLLDVTQVGFGAVTKLAPHWKISQRLSETLSPGGKMIVKLQRFLPQLLFEQRIEHDRRSASIFEAAQSLQFLREW